MVVRLLLNEVGCHRCWAADIVALPFFFSCWWPTLLGGVAIGAQAVVFFSVVVYFATVFWVAIVVGVAFVAWMLSLVMRTPQLLECCCHYCFCRCRVCSKQ